MKIVEFYRGNCPNNLGESLEDIMKFDHGEMEGNHDFIQYIFPTNEASMFNYDAPVLTKEEADIFCESPELKAKVVLSFIKFLDFLDMRLVSENPVEIAAIEPTEIRPQPLLWMYEFNHNFLRVTRCLKSMRLVGLEQYSVGLFNFLKQNVVLNDEKSFRYWENATFNSLKISFEEAIAGIIFWPLVLFGLVFRFLKG